MQRIGDAFFCSATAQRGFYITLWARILLAAAEEDMPPDALVEAVEAGKRIPPRVTEKVINDEFDRFETEPRAAELKRTCEEAGWARHAVRKKMKSAFDASNHQRYGGSTWFIILCSLGEVPPRIVELVNDRIHGKVTQEDNRNITLARLETLRNNTRKSGRGAASPGPDAGHGGGPLDKNRPKKLREDAFKKTMALREEDPAPLSSFPH